MTFLGAGKWAPRGPGRERFCYFISSKAPCLLWRMLKRETFLLGVSIDCSNFLLHSYLALKHDPSIRPQPGRGQNLPTVSHGTVGKLRGLGGICAFPSVAPSLLSKPLPLSAAICFQPYPTGRKHEHFHRGTRKKSVPGARDRLPLARPRNKTR